MINLYHLLLVFLPCNLKWDFFFEWKIILSGLISFCHSKYISHYTRFVCFQKNDKFLLSKNDFTIFAIFFYQNQNQPSVKNSSKNFYRFLLNFWHYIMKNTPKMRGVFRFIKKLFKVFGSRHQPFSRFY